MTPSSHKGACTRDEADTFERRGRAAQSRVEAGQVSRAQPELVGASLAPKTQAALDELQQVRQILPAVLAFVPEHPLELDFSLFTKCLQSAPSGRSPGPGGCSNEMWRVCLDDYEVLQSLFRAAEDFTRADIPDGTRVALMSATMTALQKPDGGQGNCNRNLIQKIGCKDVGPPIQQTG